MKCTSERFTRGRNKGGRKIHAPVDAKCVILAFAVLSQEREGKIQRFTYVSQVVVLRMLVRLLIVYAGYNHL